jgi:hypothetical protein
VLKCHIDQVERLRPVVVEVPTPAAPRQRTKVEVPQMSHYRVHERFHWPAGKSLLIGLGVVPTPTPVDPSPLRLQLPVVPPEPPRADLLVLIEDRGQVTPPQTAAEPDSAREARAPTFRGRY